MAEKIYARGRDAGSGEEIYRRRLADQCAGASDDTADMAKYAEPGESTKIQNAFRSLPAQLAKENKKFQYKLIRKGATAGLFGDSIAWLVMAGVALEADRVTRGEMPVRIFRDVSAFKLYMADMTCLTYTKARWRRILLPRH